MEAPQKKEEASTDASSTTMETTTTTTTTKTIFDRLQYDIIGTDIGHRGMKPLIVPGDLEHAARCIVDTLRTPPRASSSSSSSSCDTTILVLSGFPCCVTQVPPTETDGPPGTYAIVRAVYQLATQRNSTKNPTPQQQPQQPQGTTHIIVVTDDCNRDVFAAGLENLALSNTAEDEDEDDQDPNDPENIKDRVTINNSKNTGKNTHFPQRTTTSSRCTISLETFPASAGFTSHDHARLEHLATTTDLIISCERAGPAKDGNCYTMKGINMNEHNLIAPLEQLLTRCRRSSSSSSRSRRPKFIAIGDGGNELGMGKVLEHIRQNNPLIHQGDKIGCVVPADYLIAASVSNWGGYALAACVAVVAVTIQTSTSTSTMTTLDAITHQLDQCLPTIEQEHALLQRCVEAGCRDGVSGQRACTVDGMPFETSMDCLTAIRSTILEYYTTTG